MMINKFLNLFMIIDGNKYYNALVIFGFLKINKLEKKISLQILKLFGFLIGKLLNHHHQQLHIFDPK